MSSKSTDERSLEEIVEQARKNYYKNVTLPKLRAIVTALEISMSGMCVTRRTLEPDDYNVLRQLGLFVVNNGECTAVYLNTPPVTD